MTSAKPTILAIDDAPVNLLTLGAALKDEFDLQLAAFGSRAGHPDTAIGAKQV